MTVVLQKDLVKVSCHRKMAHEFRGRVSAPHSRFERLTPQSPPRCRGSIYRNGQNGLTTRSIGYPKSTIDDCRAG